ncbi:1-acyl-sn-glycerol-3-phosphate acyltransferase [Acetobacter sp. TBRC 12305]|uniref:1-acyl-sn-glycerol-3-phosphate acyltransferase n=1 Tax=Acetobacter garciniae TaxID=2817435 RepID=A0A939HPL2_9PROT|nr:lysophospholipid acyltransferase family protein [Acetobacter garciniae]MBO1325447.1 1-acyl-sn-glycerol-3-phosphate acyltransferase [Acetobacter garciniae]MBX0345381.1 1-acyl-sn-glycerol-3-phosphate acyltransferase [Acetobacter garciniae]
MSFLSSLNASVRFYASLVVTGLIFLCLDTGSFLLRRIMPEGVARRRAGRRWLYAMSRLAVRYLRAAGIIQCDLAALEALADEQHVVLVANHPSRMDSLILASALPRLSCVTKASIWERPVLGSTLRMAGYIRHDTLLRVIGPASERLAEGCQLLLFPEGTRSRAGDAPGPIQPGFAAIAQRTRSAVQVLLIETDSPYLSQGWPFLKRPPLPMRYAVKTGPRFAAPRRDEASGRALVETVETWLNTALANKGQPRPASPDTGKPGAQT